MVKRVPTYQLIKLRIPQNYAFPMSKHIFDKQLFEKNASCVRSVNLKYPDKFTPPNALMVARWIRPTFQGDKLIGGFFTVNIMACLQEELTDLRRTLMKEYTPIMLDWMLDSYTDEEWQDEKHSFIVSRVDGEFSIKTN